ncbi:hypothetical protein R1flu_024060 [Riccia fluitans]|uniref:Uncharacterized protein n=1 Tax=Riccia fluitans TaxID=41844 RepID=A0ABD1XTS8_9MARC
MEQTILHVAVDSQRQWVWLQHSCEKQCQSNLRSGIGPHHPQGQDEGDENPNCLVTVRELGAGGDSARGVWFLGGRG